MKPFVHWLLQKVDNTFAHATLAPLEHELERSTDPIDLERRLVNWQRNPVRRFGID